MTVLPHFSANVQRMFSQKTKSTNTLKAETVENKLFAKQSITKNNPTCCSWELNQKLINDVKDGTIRKRYQEKPNIFKHESVTHFKVSMKKKIYLIIKMP